MSDAKLSGLQSLTLPAGEDLLLVTDDPNGTPISKKMTIETLFGNVPVSASFSFNLSVAGNTVLEAVSSESITSNTIKTYNMTVTSDGIVIENTLTPASSNVSNITTGKFFYDSDYFYIKVDADTIKRVPLSSF